MGPLVVALCVVCVLILLVAEARKLSGLKAVSKTCASASFVIYAAVLWPGGSPGVAAALI